VTRVAQPLEKAEETVKKAKKTADSLSRDSKAPGDRQAADLVSDLSEAEKAISTARQELKKHEIEVKKQTDQLDKARQMALQHQEESQYWQEKHHKALEKLWFWRGLALTIAALIIAGTAGWIGWKVYGPKLPKFF
jgi:chromosome segregation ATPase